jgi:serine phosphatase RsbU (regulator of sigma subunit)/integral membrane sensor domain MASE1
MRPAPSASPAPMPRPTGRAIALALLYLAVFVLLDLASKRIERFPGVAAFFPSDGLALGLVYLAGLGTVPLVFVAYVISTCVVHGFGDIPLMLGASAVGTGLHAGTAALLARARVDLASGRLRDVMFFLAVAGLEALAGSAVITLTLVLSGELAGSAAWGALSTAFLGLGTGVVMVVPLAAPLGPGLRAWLAGQPVPARAPLDRRAWIRLGEDALVLLASTATTVLLAFSARTRAVEPTYLCFLPIIWLALRRGLPGAALAIAVVDSAVLVVFRSEGLPAPDLDKIQLLQAALACTGLVLGAVVTEREVAQSAAREGEGLRREMELAKKIQKAILPTVVPLPGFQVAGSMLPASHVGGDFYDIVRLDESDGRFWLVIGDVSGHGLDAGLVMLMAQAATQGILRARPETTPAQLVNQVNRVLYENIRLRMRDKGFVTFLALHHLGGGRFRAAGGHLPVFLIRQSGVNESVEPMGPWCGIRRDIARELDEIELQLEQGDLLCLITDGITEARSAGGQMFGEASLLASLRESADLPPSDALTELLVRVRAFQARQDDDMTAVLLKRLPTSPGELSP